MSLPDARAAIADLYADYVTCLDRGDYAAWADFFCEDCLYLVQPRENFDAGLPLALMRYESRGMLKDRAYGVANTLFHAPYYQRHICSAPRIAKWEQGRATVESSFFVIRTKRGQPSEVFVAGAYRDELREEGGAWRFERKVCVLDTELIANSLIYPI